MAKINLKYEELRYLDKLIGNNLNNTVINTPGFLFKLKLKRKIHKLVAKKRHKKSVFEFKKSVFEFISIDELLSELKTKI